MSLKEVGYVLLLLAAIGLLGLALRSSFKEQQGNNLIVRPNPNAPPPPVVPLLPKIVAELSGAKDLCEGRAQQAKDTLRQGRRRQAERELAEGQAAYTNARSAVGSCIGFLRTGLKTRFRDGDDAQIEKYLQKADAATKQFLAWADRIKPRKPRPKEVAEADPFDAIRNLWTDWLKAVRAADQKAVDDLRADLEKCRLKEWKDLDK